MSAHDDTFQALEARIANLMSHPQLSPDEEQLLSDLLEEQDALVEASDDAIGAVEMESSTHTEVSEMTEQPTNGCTDLDCDGFCDACVEAWHTAAEQYDPPRPIPTFAEDRDDAYFAELMQDFDPTPRPEVLQTWRDRISDYFEKVEAATKTEAARVRESVRADFWKRSEAGRLLLNGETRSYAAYLADEIDFHPEAESIVPEARVYRGVAWSGVEIPTPDFERTVTGQELLADLLRTVHPTVFHHSPDRAELKTKRTFHADNDAAVEDRLHMDDEEFSYVGRDEDPADVTYRWNRTPDDLEVLDMVVERNLQYLNTEILTALRREQLHRLCCWYFDTNDYRNREIVLKWDRTPNGKFFPAVKQNVVEWIESLVAGLWVEDEQTGELEFRGGDQLSGFTSALWSMKRRYKRLPDSARILTEAEVKSLVHSVVAANSQEAVDDYFEL